MAQTDRDTKDQHLRHEGLRGRQTGGTGAKALNTKARKSWSTEGSKKEANVVGSPRF